MAKINLCGAGDCCPAVDVRDDEVLIGEEGNLCRLTPAEWRQLKDLVRRGAL